VSYPKSWERIPFKFTGFDYQFLTGTWEDPKGAAFNVTGEDCYEAGLGTYGKPTEKGQKAIKQYLEDHKL
jgi:hypothetical protein